MDAFIFAIAFSSSRFRFFSCSFVSFRLAGVPSDSAKGSAASTSLVSTACLDARAAARLASASCLILLASMLCDYYSLARLIRSKGSGHVLPGSPSEPID